MREAISWSYDLLDDEQQRLLRQVAVFEGSLTSDRVQAVCAPQWGTQRTLDALDELVEKSMVQVKSTAGGQERRLFLLETVQEFGLDELEANGEREEMESRHVNYFLTLTELLAPQLREAPNERLLAMFAECA